MPNSHPDNTQELEQILWGIRDYYTDLESQPGISLDTAQERLQALITQSNLKAVEAFAEQLKQDEPLTLNHLHSYIDQELAKLKEAE